MPGHARGMGLAWDRLYSQFPPVARVAATISAPIGVTARPVLGASPLPLWVREFWLLGAFLGNRPAIQGRAQTWDAGDHSVLMQDAFRSLPRPASRGCAVAMVLGLLRRVGDCEICGRSLRGRPVIKCQRCGCRLCDAFCVRLCRRAARLDSPTGYLHVLARGCAARFCARCEPTHVCARVEPRKVLGWKCPPEAPEDDPKVPPPLPQSAEGTALQRCSSCPPGGGRVVPCPGVPRWNQLRVS